MRAAPVPEPRVAGQRTAILDAPRRPAPPQPRSVGVPEPAGRSARDRPASSRRWLVEFLRDEVKRRRGFEKVVIGLSGGVDSALVAFLAAEALGRERDGGPDALPHLELPRAWITPSW